MLVVCLSSVGTAGKECARRLVGTKVACVGVSCGWLWKHRLTALHSHVYRAPYGKRSGTQGFLAVDSLVYVGVSHARTVLRTKSCAVRLRPYCCTVRYYAASFCIGRPLMAGSASCCFIHSFIHSCGRQIPTIVPVSELELPKRLL